MSRILVITSSGRRRSNSTAMAHAFSEGAAASGHIVETVNCIDYDIRPCRGCGKCFTKNQACCLEDDFHAIAEKIDGAETIVLACPVYWYDFPAQMKLVIDKFISFLWGKRTVPAKGMILLSCAQETDEAYVFAGIDTAFESFCNHLGWPVVAKIMRGGIDHEGDVYKSDVLEKCKQLGLSLDSYLKNTFDE